MTAVGCFDLFLFVLICFDLFCLYDLLNNLNFGAIFVIPDLPLNKNISPELEYFLNLLKEGDFHGEVSLELADRVCLATDNSVYQACPEVVIFPKLEQDLVFLFKLSAKPRFKGIKFSPRGGGTGTNGQSLTTGVLVDFSKYMRKILEVDEYNKWVRVQPGVTLDELNDFLKPREVFFPLAISPSNRATIGGMFNTDACGKGSMVYGRTSENILSSKHVMHDGSILLCDSDKEEDLYTEHFTRDISEKLYHIVDKKRDLISKKFPNLQRFLSGYNLQHALWDKPHIVPSVKRSGRKKHGEVKRRYNHVDLNSLLSGSEGTLTFCTELKLKLTPLPTSKSLLVLGYKNIEDAINDGLRIKRLSPFAIEVLDENLLNLAKNDEVYYAIKDYFSFGENPDDSLGALNLIEFNSPIKNLPKGVKSSKLIIRSYETDKKDLIKSFWDIRKKGVGLLAAMEGSARPVAFVEDPVVPPENLPEFIADLKKLFDGYGLKYGLYGHVDVGCMHVRPALDLTNKEHQKWFVEITHKVNKLVKKYDGLLWAEHGKGYRGCLLQEYVGDEIYHVMREVKTFFDPNNKFNPGKIATSLDEHLSITGLRVEANSEDSGLKKLDDDFKGSVDSDIPAKMRNAYKEAFLCNGNAQCMTYENDVIMCPSYKSGFDRLHSPKGRSMLLREWLSQVSDGMKEAKVKQLELEKKGRKKKRDPNKNTFYDIILKTWNFILPRTWALNSYVQSQDFSHQVYRSMRGCLGCKACASSCPVKVNIPHMRAKFLSLYHKKFGRSWQDYVIDGFEYMSVFRKRFPFASKIIMENFISSFIIDKFAGLADLPKVKQGHCRNSRSWGRRSRKLVQQMMENKKGVCLIEDPFNSLYDANIIEQTAKIIESLGYEVFLLSVPSPGIVKHNLGMLNDFEIVAKKNIKVLNELAEFKIPILGVEPSTSLCLEDTYKKYFPNKCKYKINLVQTWLSSLVDSRVAKGKKWSKPVKGHKPYHLFTHCTERSLVSGAVDQWSNVFKYFGVDIIDKPLGCCGMSGVYGHLSENRDDSLNIYRKNWGKEVNAAGVGNVLATGFSCRCQVKRMERREVEHPLVELANLVL